MSRQPGIHVCFVAPRAYNVLAGRGDVQHIGGAEVQQCRIARGLSDRGYRVSFVTLDVGQADGESHGGIIVYRAYDPGDGRPGLRFFHPRATALWAAMKRADADVYYQRTSDTLTGIVAAFCRRHRRKFVFALGHDGDCDVALPFCPKRRERIPYRYGLKRADAVVAQTTTQQRRLLNSFGVPSTVIPSCTGAGPPRAFAARPKSAPFLWIGRFAPEKRLELLLEVAGRCREIEFDVLGDGPRGDYVRRLRQRAEQHSNVHLLGYVPHVEMARYYDRAAGLICTSVSEGFPNTFLEAWSRRVPVVTTFDPDGLVASAHLGLTARGAEALASAVRAVRFDPDVRRQLSETAYAYFLAHHTVDVVARAYDRLFQQLLARGRAFRSPGVRPTATSELS